MNHKTLIQLRNEDFADCLRKAAGTLAAERRTISAASLIDMAMAMRPRRYYLSFSTLQARYHNMRLHGAFRSAAVSRAQQQWHDFNRAVVRYRAFRRRVTIKEAMTHVINFEQPERFYISPATARAILKRTFNCRYTYVITKRVS